MSTVTTGASSGASSGGSSGASSGVSSGAIPGASARGSFGASYLELDRMPQYSTLYILYIVRCISAHSSAMIDLKKWKCIRYSLAHFLYLLNLILVCYTCNIIILNTKWGVLQSEGSYKVRGLQSVLLPFHVIYFVICIVIISCQLLWKRIKGQHTST